MSKTLIKNTEIDLTEDLTLSANFTVSNGDVTISASSPQLNIKDSTNLISSNAYNGALFFQDRADANAGLVGFARGSNNDLDILNFVSGGNIDITTSGAGVINLNGDVDVSGDLGGAIAEEGATISGGAITVTSTASTVLLTIASEGAAATDDLDTITTSTSPQVLICRSATSSQDITFKDGVDNLSIAGDFATTRSDDIITLINISGTLYEMSRSDNRP